MKREKRGRGGVLIIDDEEGIRFSLSNIFAGEGYKVRTAENRDAALKQAAEFEPDAVLLDIRLKGEDGLDVLKDIKRAAPDAAVIMITGHGSIGNSVQAMKEGAVDYILKPIDRTTILEAVGKNIELKSLRHENTYLKSELRVTRGVSTIDSVDPGVREVIRVADRVKDTGASLLITGESGSGKEVLARYVHYTSVRQNANFIGINCAALSDSLLLSELFGHEKGSFTGAHEQRPGKFELADGGTLFLDEIGDMSLEIQSKILRVLEERSFERVGGIRSIDVDVRIIAATNRDLEELIREGRFRQDLYYRLKVITCHLPPLRERREDIPLLVEGFIRRYSERYGKRIVGISPDLMAKLRAHDWPGNIRELQNIINQAVLLCEGNLITSFRGLDNLGGSGGETTETLPGGSSAAGETRDLKAATDRFVGEFEKEFINGVLEEFHGNKSKAAEAMGISRKTLARKLLKYGA